MKKMLILFILLIFNACSVTGDKTEYMTSNSSEEQTVISKSGRQIDMDTYTFKDNMKYTGAIYKPYVVVYPLVEYKTGFFALFNNEQMVYPIDDFLYPRNLPGKKFTCSYFIPKNGQTTATWPRNVTHFLVYIMDPFYTSDNRVSLGFAEAQSGSNPWHVQKLQDSVFPESREFIIQGFWHYKFFTTSYSAKIIRAIEL
ncbi:MAG: hypothetical protein ACRCTQ_00200 [Brevinemataceae bacterium]